MRGETMEEKKKSRVDQIVGRKNERIKVRGKGKEKRESRLLITKAVPDIQEMQMSQEKTRDFKQGYG